MCGKTEMPMLFIAIMYGEAAPVPLPFNLPLRMATSIGSFDGMTTETQSADPMNIIAKRM